MQVGFTSDEMILALISLVRATDLTLLRQEPDGFTVDFETLQRKAAPNPDERLLLRMGAALEQAAADGGCRLELTAAEGRRLADTLGILARMQVWAPDVTAMLTGLRARLAPGGPGGSASGSFGT